MQNNQKEIINQILESRIDELKQERIAVTIFMSLFIIFFLVMSVMMIKDINREQVVNKIKESDEDNKL